MKKHLVLACMFIFSGCQKNLSVSNASSSSNSSPASESLTQLLCANHTISKVVAAYPQARMTESQLKTMKIGDGIEKARAFSAALPGILSPIKEQMTKDPLAWPYIHALSSRGAVEFKKRNWDPEFKAEWNEFCKNVDTKMRRVCPSEFSKPGVDKFSEFAIGTIMGFFGRP